MLVEGMLSVLSYGQAQASEFSESAVEWKYCSHTHYLLMTTNFVQRFATLLTEAEIRASTV